MKHKFLIATMFAVIVAGGMTSCKYDDSELWNEVRDHENRIAQLESLCKQMNTNITSLQTIVAALQDNDYVTSITPITSGRETIGYTINFSKSGPVTIYHGNDGKDGIDGTDGHTPIIGVRQSSDGNYYWTLDGNWLLDDDGNIIKANGTDGKDGAAGEDGQDGTDGESGADGQDGKDGITPQLKIVEGYWYVSYDNGSSWTQLGKATGENGNDGKDGVDGDSMFSKVTYDDEFVYLVLADNVTTLTIPRKVNDFDLQFEGGNNLACSSGETVSVKYTLTYGNANTEVAAIPHGGWEAKVEETDNASGIITVTAPNPMKDGEVIVLASDGTGKTVMKKLIFDEGVVTIATKSYVVDSKQTTISVELSTNLDYTVSIPDDAKSWISVSDIQTKSTMRNDVVSLNIVANTDNPTRTANISFVNSANEILNTISILQTSSTIANNEIWYTSSDGNIIEPNNFSGNIVSNMYGNGKGVIVFEDNLTEIWESAFKECSNLKRITIPNTVTSIGTTAFWRCFNLEEVEIPTNVSTIEDGAFFDCNSLIRITIPENVTSIDCCLFFCSGLIEFTIHSNVTSICCGAFSGCNNLEALYCCPVIPPTYERAEYGDIDDIGISVKTKIYVPTESVEQYKSAEGWSQYASQIVGYDFSE